MASPLSPAHDAQLNSANSMTKRKYDDYDKIPASPRRGSVGGQQAASTTPERAARQTTPSMSSPSLLHHHALGLGQGQDQENPGSPSRIGRGSRVMTGGELSPVRLAEAGRARTAMASMAGAVAGRERTASLDGGAGRDEGRQGAVRMFEDGQSVLEREADGEGAAHDESVMSTFSTFSAVPGMTMFAKLGHTPSKPAGLGGGGGGSMTPRMRRDAGPASSLASSLAASLAASSSPLKSSLRPRASYADMLDFSSKKTGAASPHPARATPRTAQTPSSGRAQQQGAPSLLDFDIPPMPTPRSIPSITPRELESLKSRFLSEISSLKASLSGKEAEVESLKSAVGDAEKRVGRSLEQLREERAVKEQLAAEREGWEQRGREMEGMLRKIREELVVGQREREDLERQLDESEKRRESAEMLQQEAETKLSSLRGDSSNSNSNSNSNNASPSDKQPAAEDKAKASNTNTNREVEIAVERVARELHALYKSKHETKVAALKRSYENRWEKKVRGLEAKLDEASAENERLRAGHQSQGLGTGTGAGSGSGSGASAGPDEAEAAERKAQAVRDSATIKELTANVQRVEAVVGSLERDNEELRSLLQQERVEKGELVQLAEELMGMQQSFVPPTAGEAQSQAGPPPNQSQPPAQTQAQTQVQMPADTTAPKAARPAPVARSSGLRAPGASGLRAPAATARIPGASSASFSASTSGFSASASTGGLPRPGVRGGGIMGSIERMGNYRGRGE